MFHPLWCKLLVTKDYANLGIVGVGIAGIITDFSVLMYNMLYSYCDSRVRPAVFLPDKQSFDWEGLKDYFRIGLPSSMLIVLDCYAGTMVTFISGYISLKAQSAQVILGSIMVFLYMVGRGLEQASCAIVGQHLGKNMPVRAK